MRLGKYSFYVIVMGFVVSGYMVYSSPSTAAAQIPIVLGLTATLAKLFDTDTKVDAAVAKVEIVETKVDSVAVVSSEAKAAAVESKEVSEGNALALATVAEQTAHTLEQQAQQTAQIAQQVDDNTRVTIKTQNVAQETLVMADGHLTNALKEGQILREKVDRLEGFVTALLQEKAVKMNEQTHEGGMDRIATAIETIVPAIMPPIEKPPDL